MSTLRRRDQPRGATHLRLGSQRAGPRHRQVHAPLSCSPVHSRVEALPRQRSLPQSRPVRRSWRRGVTVLSGRPLCRVWDCMQGDEAAARVSARLAARALRRAGRNAAHRYRAFAAQTLSRQQRYAARHRRRERLHPSFRRPCAARAVSAQPGTPCHVARPRRGLHSRAWRSASGSGTLTAMRECNRAALRAVAGGTHPGTGSSASPASASTRRACSLFARR